MAEDINELGKGLENLHLNLPVWTNWKISEYLNENILCHVCKHLDVDGPIMKNWRHLGGHFNVQSIDLDIMENEFKSSRSPSKALFQHLFATYPNVTFCDFFEVLIKLERNDIKEEIMTFMDQQQCRNERTATIPGGCVEVDGQSVVTQSHCRELSTHINTSWKSFLRQCRLNEKISQLEKLTDLREESYRALMVWVEERKYKGTIPELKSVFRDIGRRDLADYFDEFSSITRNPPNVRDDAQVDEYLIHSLTEDIGPDWKWVLRYLDVKEQVIRNVDHQYSELEDKIVNGLLKWKKRNGAGARKSKLAAALCNVGKAYLINDW